MSLWSITAYYSSLNRLNGLAITPAKDIDAMPDTMPKENVVSEILLIDKQEKRNSNTPEKPAVKGMHCLGEHVL